MIYITTREKWGNMSEAIKDNYRRSGWEVEFTEGGRA
jgi:hypothetical protein